MEEITRMVRVAYDPAAQETIEESDEPPYIAWEDCGPLMHEAGWSHYSHEFRLSRTWEMVDPPQSNVTADTLTRLLSPLADCDRKRVTVLYRMLPPDKTMFMAEQNRQKAANQVSQEKRATVRSMSQIGKANRQAVETNQGAVMVFFGMLVTVTVSRGEQESQRLEAASRAVEQAAGGAKIDLRPCYGAQDTGFAASLPLGLNVRSYTPAGPPSAGSCPERRTHDADAMEAVETEGNHAKRHGHGPRGTHGIHAARSVEGQTGRARAPACRGGGNARVEAAMRP